MIMKPATTTVPINDILSSRWSGRAFDVQKKVSREQILSICEAGRWSPSCYGDEPWRVIVCDKFTDIPAWKLVFECLAEFNQKWVMNAQVILIVLSDTEFRRGGVNRWAQYDTGACAENICLQSTAIGLMAHQMGGFDSDKLIANFKIPDRFIPMSIIAIGYRSEEDVLEETYKILELAPRKRLPLGSTFFEGSWENPIIKV